MGKNYSYMIPRLQKRFSTIVISARCPWQAAAPVQRHRLAGSKEGPTAAGRLSPFAIVGRPIAIMDVSGQIDQ